MKRYQKPSYSEYVEDEFNTSFTYLLDEKGQAAASLGIKDLTNCLPYSLMFVPEIESVEIHTDKKVYYKVPILERLNDNINLISTVLNKKEEKETTFTFVSLTKNFTSIVVPIKKEKDSISLLSINEKNPRLYCAFPLIGTEKFPFPTIINNPHFNPTDSRDGIFLEDVSSPHPRTTDNREYIKEALDLYFQLLEYAIAKNWKNLYVLAQIPKDIDRPKNVRVWYQKTILTPIREKLSMAKIVKTANDKLRSMRTKENKNCIFFPHSNKEEIRYEIWRCANYWIPHRLPTESHIHIWHRTIWDGCTKLSIRKFAQLFAEKIDKMKKLSEMLQGIDMYKWLNKFYALLKLEEREYDTIINNYAIFPDQNGVFRERDELNKDAGDIDIKLKDILKLLGNDIRAKLLDDRVDIDLGDERKLNKKHVIKEITVEIQDKTRDRELAKKYTDAFKELLNWFNDYPSDAATSFPVIYEQKHILLGEEIIIENYNTVEELNKFMGELEVNDLGALRETIIKLMDEFQVKDLKRLQEVIKEGYIDNKISVTAETLISMGVTSEEEWKEAVKDQNLAEIFSHESTPTKKMYEYAQAMISKAKDRVKEYLNESKEYDISQIDEDTAAPTILAGVIKDGKEITIIVRPAYNGEVIIYYGSERDILDLEPNSELWIDDVTKPRKITLGHILKTANIIKFPV